MKGTEPIKIEEPFKGDDKVYYVNGGRCSGKVDKTINELVDYINKLQQENKQLKENYERTYNENCILREKHNINDIGLLDENYKLKQVIDKLIEYLQEKYNSSNLCGIVLNFTEFEDIKDLLKEVE